VYLLRHKWYVFLECVKLGIVWRGIVHDLSKFSPAEFKWYAEKFFSGKKTDEIEKGFDRAWLHHQRVNDHHWQWWVKIKEVKEGGKGLAVEVLPMPDPARREMLADWRGAGRAQGKGDDVKEWYEANRDRMILHDETRAWIEEQIYGGEVDA